ncbi:DUF3732 domain-containing protein [Sinorhizobium medicae]|uniref:DUF3732 domain-containing protein n=1 Tax=Sinorhizobium medicae TaxID=110321 RepID=UPI000FDCCB71|nr:DUF3732 domain-containing protein [Sinorhizobium medicae]MDX0439143.1 DUF3732 domain-containing protein [Sinorhizobium medicae]MDX0617562.1 DUF3732 domain-containing protein [Sinorhizobium medicae]MDX0654711.1 DUF3732 domain-containing protein [Sinorhizobium medicae]MDX1090919.1 DUF3732 domain-containing protein [Sinorhizobium medicae]MDX1115554.1 DUF3732 domain-containing protein [Sinorhizobium medicae]
MKFHIESLQLWLKSKQRRFVTFLPNKVNVITGESHTGKTAILDIVDYCMFASEHGISESIINENVAWYGLHIHVNDKIYLLARRAPEGKVVSPDYYLSSTGELPESEPIPNISESVLKKLLSADFGLDQDVKIPFGGRTLRANSRVSLRYFLLFNTISQDIITHSDQFFDKQNKPRYQEALPRIFDIAVGIDTVENILKREKRAELERKLVRQENLAAKTEQKREQFNAQLAETVARAKGYGLVADNTAPDATIDALKQMVTERESGAGRYVSAQYEEISSQIYRVSRKIRGLHRFTTEFAKHKATLKETGDSLQPVAYLLKNFEETVQTSVFDDILQNLSQGLEEIKHATARNTPLDSNISEIIKDLESQREKLEKDLHALPVEMESFENDKEKYIFIGETKAKLELYSDPQSDKAPDNSELIANLEAEIGDLTVAPVEDRKELFTKALDEAIQDYITLTKAALGNYGDYRSAFNYSEKKLHLRKPRTTTTENVGSSSNHMFLHLFLFLGLHELIMRNEGDHVAPFLIIDQFSRPYWGEDDEKDGKGEQDVDESDVAKVRLALGLLDQFITTANDMGKEFQMIVFEHINPRYWDGLKNVHLVEIFRDGNALIPVASG